MWLGEMTKAQGAALEVRMDPYRRLAEAERERDEALARVRRWDQLEPLLAAWAETWQEAKALKPAGDFWTDEERNHADSLWQIETEAAEALLAALDAPAGVAGEAK